MRSRSVLIQIYIILYNSRFKRIRYNDDVSRYLQIRVSNKKFSIYQKHHNLQYKKGTIYSNNLILMIYFYQIILIIGCNIDYEKNIYIMQYI